MLQIFYRLSRESRPEVRPPFFSKRGAFLNFLSALRVAPETRLHIIFDRADSEDYEGEAILALAPFGTQIERVQLGNSGTFRYAYDLALNLNADDLVYFVEDDYLHTPDSVQKLHSAAKVLPAEYFTLYDHPVRYATDYKFGLDLPTRHQKILYVCEHHWRPQESTCMTFAAHVATLRSDREIFARYTSSEAPQDRELFRRLQGLVGYEAGSPFRTLLGPIPSLATHCHEPWLAPGRDWGRIYKETVGAN